MYYCVICREYNLNKTCHDSHLPVYFRNTKSCKLCKTLFIIEKDFDNNIYCEEHRTPELREQYKLRMELNEIKKLLFELVNISRKRTSHI